MIMAVIENTTMTTDIKLQAREIDFISRFNNTWDALREIMGIMRPIRKTPGTKLVSVKATVDLKEGNIPERDMYNTFNMGVGMVVILPADQADKAMALLAQNGQDSYVLGEIVPGEGVELL